MHPARQIPQEQLPKPLQQFREFNEGTGTPVVWPGFGWEGYCVDASIGTDSDDAMRFCHEQGFIDHTTKTLYNTPLRAYCEQRKAVKCAALLKKLGYPL